MFGTLVNGAAIIFGGLIGILLKKGIPEKIQDTIMKGVGLCVMYIGITGIIKGEETLLMILSIVLGAIVGETLDLDGKLTGLGKLLERKFKGNGGTTSIAEGFISSSLLFCVGALAIVGPLEGGVTGNYEILYTKAVIDGITAVIFASSLGVGVIFSAVLVIIYQGSFALLAQWIAPYLSDAVVREMSSVGSLILIGLALNTLGVTKLKVINYIPAIFISIILCLIF
jgi:uncharacterized membrane protein YqgA involved in biofilm formation